MNFSWDNRGPAASSTMKALLLTLLAGCTLIPLKSNQSSQSPQATPVDPGPWDGPLAQKHAGKVVFSSAPIPYDGTDDGAVYATYQLGDPLFIRMWSKDAPHNLLPCREYGPRTIQVKADVNGERAGQPLHEWPGVGYFRVDAKKRTAIVLSGEADHAFTTRVDYSADQEPMGKLAVRAWNTKIIPRLRDGKNTIRVVIGLACANSKELAPVAEGTLEVDVQPGALAAYLDKYGPRAPTSPHPDNEVLARDILEAMKKLRDWDNEIFVGAVVTSEDWVPVRNPRTGVIVAQEIDALLYARLKREKDPNACRQFKMSYRRDPAGGPLYRAGTGSSIEVPCSVAPKR